MKMTVEYDYKNRVIQIPVYVEEGGRVLTPPVAIPGCHPENPPEAAWTLQWNIHPESPKQPQLLGVRKKEFLPPAAEWLKLEMKVGGPDCQARVTSTADHASCACLELILPDDGNGKPIYHDPTIAVTLDPIDPTRGKPYAGSLPGGVLTPSS